VCGGGGGAKAPRPLVRTQLTPALHPWGSHQRAYLALLPPPGAVRTCLYFTDAEVEGLRGTPAGPNCAESVRNVTMTYVPVFQALGPPTLGGAALIDGFEKCERAGQDGRRAVQLPPPRRPAEVRFSFPIIHPPAFPLAVPPRLHVVALQVGHLRR